MRRVYGTQVNVMQKKKKTDHTDNTEISTYYFNENQRIIIKNFFDGKKNQNVRKKYIQFECKHIY